MFWDGDVVRVGSRRVFSWFVVSLIVFRVGVRLFFKFFIWVGVGYVFFLGIRYRFFGIFCGV